jgi:DinB family protein
MSNLTAAQELLRDSFTRLIEHVDELTDGLDSEVAAYRPTPQANSVAWLIWHSARVQDVQVCDIAKTLADGRSDKPRSGQVWTRDGWVDRFGLDLPRDDTGYGHSADAVAKVRASAELLAGYYRAVHDMTLEFVETLTDADLERIVDRRWDPPVTASARLVSIVDDCAQHLGQAAYLRGIT